MKKLPDLFFFTVPSTHHKTVFRASFDPDAYEGQEYSVTWTEEHNKFAVEQVKYSREQLTDYFKIYKWEFEPGYDWEYEHDEIDEGIELGVYRPNLDDRKVGKVPMHMVLDGFPHALQHLGEIMGWAADKKGYALHDWKNLPNAFLELPAANYRHGSENSKQKANGIPAIERTDHESAKLHIMHQVFNLLAEAELVLTNKIS